jgi:hypothetical protein
MSSKKYAASLSLFPLSPAMQVGLMEASCWVTTEHSIQDHALQELEVGRIAKSGPTAFVHASAGLLMTDL